MSLMPGSLASSSWPHDLAEGNRYLAVEVGCSGASSVSLVSRTLQVVSLILNAYQVTVLSSAIPRSRGFYQERGELVARSGFGLKQGENPESDGHEIQLLSACVCEYSAFRDRDAAGVLAQAADRAHDSGAVRLAAGNGWILPRSRAQSSGRLDPGLAGRPDRGLCGRGVMRRGESGTTS